MKIAKQMKVIALVVLTLLALTACGSEDAASPEVVIQTVVETVEVPFEVITTVEVMVTQAPETPAELTTIPISLGYRATVLYAPLYVADALGYFAEEGIELDWEYGGADDIMVLLASGERPILSGSGGEVLLARAQGMPVVYFYQWHSRDNYAIFSLAESGITEPADLVGKTIGVPFLAGGNYLGLQAVLWAEGLSEGDMSVQSIGYTQIAAVSEGTVDAAVGVIYNEPKVLAASGLEINIIETADYQPLIGSGFAVNEQFMQDNPEVVQGFANAFTKGLAYTIENPWEAFQIALGYIPETNAAGEVTRLDQLISGIQCCDGGRLGFSDPEIWEELAQFLFDTGWLTETLDVTEAYTNDFIGDTEVWPAEEEAE
ncbi:MAG: ABC transporter substrate-binding protein [Chloroflexi bacterium]|nr:ABC transporter substrate-binding protein [Chloroflexota bacterium]